MFEHIFPAVYPPGFYDLKVQKIKLLVDKVDLFSFDNITLRLL